MSKRDLPLERIYSNAFKERGRDDVVKIDLFPVSDGELLTLTFESTDSPWRQGAWLKTDMGLIINEQECPSAVLWQDNAPKEVLIECRTKNGCMHVYNMWDRGLGPSSLAWSSGMLVEDLPNGRRYRCNDIGFETNFSKLVFRIERGSSAT
ncbi:MAG: hypothetical protein EA379_05695 [Phycisphaerales bacterium]|nr:MAG: hypothetical protein EA379_05695 [Phycisphaerales bacterium]